MRQKWFKSGRIEAISDGVFATAMTLLVLELKLPELEGPVSGESTVKMDFACDGGKPGSGGTATLFINGKQVGTARVEKTEANVFSADETANVGIDKETMVTDDYDRESSEFTGKIDKVTITLK